MAVYQSSEQLTAILRRLFEQVIADPEAARKLSQSKLIVRFKIHDPAALVTLNGRTMPPQLSMGAPAPGAPPLRPDLEVEVSADALHQILLAQLRLRVAITSKQVKVHGPVWKSLVLQDIFHTAQALYPKMMGK
jgi:hypothetical protein